MALALWLVPFVGVMYRRGAGNCISSHDKSCVVISLEHLAEVQIFVLWF